MRKKVTSLFLVMAMGIAVAACGSKQTTSSADQASAPAESATADTGATESTVEGADTSMEVTDPVTLTTISQGAGTDDYITTAAETKLFSEKLPQGSKVTQETISMGCSSAGYLIEAGQGDFATGQNAMSATVGLEGHKPYSSISALLATKRYAFVAELATQNFVDKTGCSTVAEVLEKKIPCRFVAEPVGSSDYVSFMYLLDIHGVTQKDIESWGGSVTFTDGSACCDMLQDGQADMMVGHTVATSSSLTELCMSADIVISGLTDDEVDGMCERGYAPAEIPVGSFGKTTEVMKSACQASSKIVSSNMDEKLAYSLTKILVEGADVLGQDVAGFKDVTYEDMVNFDAMVVPMHPGAKKYFQDIGVLDADGKYTGKTR